MRVLHFLPVYAPAWQFGGPVLSVSRLCEGLVRQGVDVRVITTNCGLPDFPNNQLGVPQNLNGVQVIYFPVDQQGRTIRSRALAEALPEQMAWAELLHLSSIWQPLGLQVQTVAHAAGIPVIQTLRGALGPYSWRRGFWKKAPYFCLKERPLLQRAAALHCTTSQEAREIAWLGLKPPINILPNPIDFSQIHFSQKLRLEWRQRMGIALEKPLLLVAGRLHHKKGLDLLPKVLQGIAHRPWQIVFIGKDEDGTGRKLKKVLRRFGLEDRCHWLDHLPADQLSGPYNAADCLLLPSRHENFGNVVVEALACGCGVLISDRVGVADSIRTCPGVHIIPRTTQSWRENLLCILASQRPGLLSREWVAHSFSIPSVAGRFKQTYNLIVKHPCIGDDLIGFSHS